MPAVAKLSVGTKGWADRINAAWDSSVAGVIEAGKILLQCKAEVSHGEFAKMTESQLHFNARTAQRLMAVAKDDRLSNPTHASLLPQAWTTLYELTKLKDDEFEVALKSGEINPKMQRKDAPKPRRANGSTITDAQYTEVRSPAPLPSTPESAVPAGTLDPVAPLVQAAAQPLPGGEGDTREGGDTRVSEAIPAVRSTPPIPPTMPEGTVAYYIKPGDPYSALGNALAMARRAVNEITEAGGTQQDAIEKFPPHLPLYPDDLTKLVDWLVDFDTEFRGKYPHGNEAAMREVEAEIS